MLSYEGRKAEGLREKCAAVTFAGVWTANMATSVNAFRPWLVQSPVALAFSDVSQQHLSWRLFAEDLRLLDYFALPIICATSSRTL